MITEISDIAGLGSWELLIILIGLGIPIILIVFFFKHLSRSGKEKQKLRLELGKLADELEQVRKQAESGKGEKNEPPAES